METQSRTRNGPWPKSFEPTYEGWKHSPFPRGRYARPSFEPTYEGWKHYFGIIPYNSEPGFEPTYEGWKHPAGFDAFHAALSVLSLPMRDGNSDILGQKNTRSH